MARDLDDDVSQGDSEADLPEVPGYRLDAVLGHGSSAIVCRAEHLASGQQVAIKILLVATKNLRRRLRREFRALQSLTHPNIVRGIELVELRTGAPALVLELVTGPTLAELLAAGTLSEDQRYFIADALLDGVRAAHAVGLIHRDLKPANVLCTPNENSFTPRIVDFGLVKGHREGETMHTQAGALMGTPQYMAPEQVRDSAAVDQRADVFALGAILYELATGQVPFVGDALTILENAAMGRFVAPRELKPELPIYTELAIIGALLPDPAQRVPDVGTLQALWRGQTALARYTLPPEILPFADPDLAERLSRADSRGSGHPRSLPPRSTPQFSSGSGQNVETWPINRVPPSAAPTLPKPGRTGWKFAVFAVFAVVGVSTVLGSLIVGRSLFGAAEEQAPPPTAAAALRTQPPPAEIPPPKIETPAPPLVTFRIETVPSGAMVRRGTLTLGNTPLELQADDAWVDDILEARLNGFRPATVLVPRAGGTVSITLEAEPRVRRPPPRQAEPLPRAEPTRPVDPLLDPWEGE